MFWTRAAQRRIDREAQRLTDEVEHGVQRYGWMGVPVGKYGREPNWAYSVGFRDLFGEPEVIVFDLPDYGCRRILATVANGFTSGELTLIDGASFGDDERPPVWRRVHPTQFDNPEAWFALGTCYYATHTGDREFEAFQLVLTAPNGSLPWESGYPDRLRRMQPELYLPYTR